MAVIVNDIGLMISADVLKAYDGTIKLHLCKKNFTPTRTSVVTDFTSSSGEADFDGYAEQAIGTPTVTWDAVNGWWVLAWAQQTFTKSAGATVNTIYCWYALYKDSDGTYKLLMHDVFSPAQTLANTGDQIKITPSLLIKP